MPMTQLFTARPSCVPTRVRTVFDQPQLRPTPVAVMPMSARERRPLDTRSNQELLARSEGLKPPTF